MAELLTNGRFLERRKCITSMTDQEIEEIAERAAEKAIAKITDHLYQQVGRTVTEKFVWLIGLVTVGAFIWLQSKGFIHD